MEKAKGKISAQLEAKRKEAQEAKQLADANRKLAEVQAELDDLRRAQEEFEQEEKILFDNQTNNHYTENHSLHHEGYHHHEDHFQRRTHQPSPLPQSIRS
jgi:chromosome segregation ATPase